MKLRFAAFWSDRLPQTRRPSYPRHRLPLDTRVAVVGGGLTGCAVALSLAASRVPVVLLEADRIGSGATAGALGLVREDFDAPFSAAASVHGLRAARILWQGMRRAALDFPAALRRFRIRCELTDQDLLWAAPADRVLVRDLRREYEARRGAGFEPRWITASAVSREAGLESGGAIRTRGVVLDPVRACVGLAAAAAERGALVFEHSAVRRIRPMRQHVEVQTAAATIRAERVVVAAAAPIPDLRPLRRHFHPRHRYGVASEPLPASVRREVGRRAVVLRDTSAPPHYVRWLADDRVMIHGADQDPVPVRAQQPALVQRTGQLMYELSLLYPAISGSRPQWAWFYSVDDSADGLPCIGTHRNFPRHLFALGLDRHGAGAAWLAARLVLRQVTGQSAKGDDLFGFARILTGH
jgi:glycine/D-amino acid oxidase-like deaminating enzyme